MKRKWFESLMFLSVFVLLFIGVRLALSGVGRTPHVYDYAETLNLEEKEDVKPEKQAEIEEKEEPEEEEEKEEKDPPQKTPEPQDPPDPPEEEPERDEQPQVPPEDPSEQPPAEDAPVSSSSPQDSSEQEGPGASDEGSGDTQDGDGAPGTGDEEGEGDGPMVTPEPTLPPIPDPSATPIPTRTPIPTEAPPVVAPPTTVPDEIVSITCEWPDKDKPEYGKKMPDSTLKVYAVYRSGKKEELDKNDCYFLGLNNKVCGIRQFTVFYEDFEYTMDYTVNNYMVGIEFSWVEETNRFRKGVVLNDDWISVYAEMADGKLEDIRYGDYLMEGIDNLLVDVEQAFTITYKGFHVSGTCRFEEQEWISEMRYYTDNTYTTLLGSEEERLNPSRVEMVPSYLGGIMEWSGKQYRVVKQTLVVDGKTVPIARKLNEKRNMKVHVTYECVCIE